MTVTHDAPVVPTSAAAMPHPTPSPASRTVPVLVRGTSVLVPCPSWCVADHSEDLACLEDLRHEGAQVSMQVPAYDREAEPAMVAYMAQWPFAAAEEDRRPYLALAAVDDGECVGLDAATVQSVARGMEEHAARLRALSGQLAAAA